MSRVPGLRQRMLQSYIASIASAASIASIASFLARATPCNCCRQHIDASTSACGPGIMPQSSSLQVVSKRISICIHLPHRRIIVYGNDAHVRDSTSANLRRTAGHGRAKDSTVCGGYAEEEMGACVTHQPRMLDTVAISNTARIEENGNLGKQRVPLTSELPSSVQPLLIIDRFGDLHVCMYVPCSVPRSKIMQILNR